jgi:HK97 gp10 family phage protein
VTVSADFSELLTLADDLDEVPAQSDRNIAGALDVTAEKMLAEMQANVPIGETHLLYDSLAIERDGPKVGRIGSLNGPGAARAHLTENGTAIQPPQPFIRPAGDRYEDEFASDVADGPFWAT